MYLQTPGQIVMRRQPSERPSGEAGEASGRRSAAKPPKRIAPTRLRIIGGELRRRNVVYSGNRLTRPMKDNIRENLFNILGKGVVGTVAYDLFAGTGILAIEAISRGAKHAIAIDSSRESVRSIRKSADSLDLGNRLEVLLGDTFRLAPLRLQHAVGQRRVVFCCPPYAMWTTHHEALEELLRAAIDGAAEGSLIVAESDRTFDPATLLDPAWVPDGWDVRSYGHTRLAIAEVGRISEA